jgi:cell wall-associated NlpC family hydrolase
MKALIDDWRMASQAAAQAPAPAAEAAPAGDQTIRDQAITIALGQVGKRYVPGAAGPTTFDCSGLVQWSYAQIGRTTTRTTFSQLDNLPAIQPEQGQPGDMIYFQYPWDQHVGILADIDGDGTWDMVHAAAPGLGVIVTNDVFNDAFYTDAIIGYRSAL